MIAIRLRRDCTKCRRHKAATWLRWEPLIASSWLVSHHIPTTRRSRVISYKARNTSPHMIQKRSCQLLPESEKDWRFCSSQGTSNTRRESMNDTWVGRQKKCAIQSDVI